MHKLTVFFACFILLLISHTVSAQTIPAPYEAGTWPGFRNAAFSFTFDDGSPNQYAKAIPIFNEFGFPLTLFIVTSPDWGSWVADWPALRAAAAQGHEIASHTVTHTNMGGMSDSVQTMELKESKDKINAEIPGNQCYTMAYPFCVAAKKAICQEYYIAARICSGSLVSRNPGDFMNLSSIICGDQGSVRTAQNFISQANAARKNKSWAVFLLHGVDNDGGWSPISSDVLRETLTYLRDNPDIWVTTFGNAARYIKERNAATVVETAVLDSSITLQVTDTLPDSLFNLPISLRRPLPDRWASATVTQNGQPVEAQIVTVDSTTYVQFDVVPDGGNVVLTRVGTVGVQIKTGQVRPAPELRSYPNPFNPTTTIDFELAQPGHVTFKVFDTLGRQVEVLLNEKMPAGQHTVVFDAGGLESGVYFCHLVGEDFVLQRKVLLLR